MIEEAIEAERKNAAGRAKEERIRQLIDSHQVSGRALLRRVGFTPAELAAMIEAASY